MALWKAAGVRKGGSGSPKGIGVRAEMARW